jgi:hypothetical protein
MSYTHELSVEELELHGGELLPTRETLAFFNFTLVSATNTSIAANVLTFGSVARSSANQLVFVHQS